jgi:hypothetical protein
MLVFWVVTPCGLAGGYRFGRELVSTATSRRRYNPEDLHLHQGKNLKNQR